MSHNQISKIIRDKIEAKLGCNLTNGLEVSDEIHDKGYTAPDEPGAANE